MKSLHISILSLLLITSTCFAETATHQMERFTKQVPIDKPTLVKVNNPYGDIRIRKADDGLFIYHGVAQSQHSQAVTLDFKQDKDQIIATVKYSDPENTNHLDRYDLALVVPPLVSLEVEIEGGDLSTKGLDSAIKATSESSNIKVKTSGPVDLFSKNGKIELSLKNTKQPIKSTIKTHVGHVSVIFYDDMPRFEINTGSHVTSNSAPLLKSLSKVKRTAYYGDSENKHHLMITSDTGQISLIDLAH